MATVSVIIPTCNGRSFIGDALRSVFVQTAPPQEIIVVDDGSRDDTVAVVEAMVPAAPVPVRLIRLEKNSGGPALPLNVGIQAAGGEFLAVLDQDDLFLPTKLEDQVGLLARQPEVAFVFSFCGFPDALDKPALESEQVERLLVNSQEKEGYRRLEGPVALRLLLEWGNWVWGYPGFVFRRSHWQQKGGLDTGLQIASDYDLLCWLCTRGAVGMLPAVHYVRRHHGNNLSHRAAEAHLEVARIRCRYLVRQRWLTNEEGLSQWAWVQDWILGQAQSSFGARRYRDALAYYRLSLRTWGWGPESLRRTARRLPRPPVRRLLRRCGLVVR